VERGGLQCSELLPTLFTLDVGAQIGRLGFVALLLLLWALWSNREIGWPSTPILWTNGSAKPSENNWSGTGRMAKAAGRHQSSRQAGVRRKWYFQLTALFTAPTDNLNTA